MANAKFPGRYISLAKICEYVVQAARDAGLDGASTYEIQLAVNEASANIIDHAYGGESERIIECVCQDDEEGLVVILRDWGQSFDPREIHEEDFDVPLEQLTMRGAGIRIMRRAVDEIDYHSAPNGMNELKLKKSRIKSKTPGSEPRNAKRRTKKKTG